MKKLFLLSVVVLSACSVQQDVKTPKLQVLSRQQVVDAIKECREAHLKPKIEYVDVETNLGTVNMPVNIQCTPFTE
jgi:hypothetical protein